MFEQFQPKVEELVKMQRNLVTKLLAEAKIKIASDDKKTREEGAVLLYRCFKGLPKNGALIKYLSEPGIKPLLLETEAIYMADNNRRMPEITDDLYFVIDEKNNGIDMTDKGLDVMTGKSDAFSLQYAYYSKSKRKRVVLFYIHQSGHIRESAWHPGYL